MNVRHAGDAAFSVSVSAPIGAWATGLETGLTILVLVVSLIAGVYSIIWNRIRLRNERKKSDEQSK